MHVETWQQLITFLQRLLPILSPADHSAAQYVIEWCKTYYGKTSGVDKSAKSNVIHYLMDISGRIPASWMDEIREANMFLARLDTSPDGDKWHTQAGCRLWKKVWYDNKCHDAEKPAVVKCSEHKTSNACIAGGCYWWDGACHNIPKPAPLPCSEWPDRVTCQSKGCYWWNNACHAETEPVRPPPPPPPPPPPAVPKCEDHKTEVECLTGGCYWWGGACHNEPEIISPGVSNPVREFAKQVTEYCSTIPITQPLKIANCVILSAILNITADVFDFLGKKN